MSDVTTVKIYLPYPQLAEGSLLELKPEHWDDETIKILLLELTKAFSDADDRRRKAAEQKADEDFNETLELERVSQHLAAVMNCPATPTRIYNVLADELCYHAEPPSTTPDTVFSALSALRRKEDQEMNSES